MRARGERVGGRMPQVDLAIAVAIDCEAQEYGRRELGLAERARPGSRHLRRRVIFRLHDPQRGEEFRPRVILHRTVVGEGGERAEQVEPTGVSAVIALHPPDRDENFRRDSIAVLDRGQHRRIGSEQRLGLAHPLRPRRRVDILPDWLGEFGLLLIKRRDLGQRPKSRGRAVIGLLP